MPPKASIKVKVGESQPQRSSASPPPKSTDCKGPVAVERRTDHSAVLRWTIAGIAAASSRKLCSPYFEIAGHDFRLALHPRGDAHSLPGHAALYIQAIDQRGTKLGCFATYKLEIANRRHKSKSVRREGWHRFTAKSRSRGWTDFVLSSKIFDPELGLLSDDSLLIVADVRVLDETFTYDSHGTDGYSDEVSGKVSWTVGNFSLFKDLLKTLKLSSPNFQAAGSNLFVSLYVAAVDGVDYLTLFLECKVTDFSDAYLKSYCCMFRTSLSSQKPGVKHIHKDTFGRFGTHGWEIINLGWGCIELSKFLVADNGFLVNDKVEIAVSYHLFSELWTLPRSVGLLGKKTVGASKKHDGIGGKVVWKIHRFTKLKELFKKRKIRDLGIKSPILIVGDRECRLTVYPRGHGHPPSHLSIFLEVQDSQTVSCEWSSFVSYRLSLVNQRTDDRSITKESRNRYSSESNNIGWREFVTLNSLFDQDSGFLVQDTLVLSMEILILKEKFVMQEDWLKLGFPGTIWNDTKISRKSPFAWFVENITSFERMMETSKIFSKLFKVDGFELRFGFHTSLGTIFAGLECDPSIMNDPDKNFWVSYRMGLLNQNNPNKNVWATSSFCTRTENNSLVKLIKFADMMEADAGFLVRGTIIFIWEILDYCPWFEFSGLEVLSSHDGQDSLLTNSDQLLTSEGFKEGISCEEDKPGNLLAKTESFLEKDSSKEILVDAGLIAGFLSELNVYLSNPIKVYHFLPPATPKGGNDGEHPGAGADQPSIEPAGIIMGLRALQDVIVDQLWDIMVDCCRPSEGISKENADYAGFASSHNSELVTQSEINQVNGASDCVQSPILDRMGTRVEESVRSCTEQCLDTNWVESLKECLSKLVICFLEKNTNDPANLTCHPTIKIERPEQSEVLLGLIVNSLKDFYCSGPQVWPELKRFQSAQKIAVILEKFPKHLKLDIITLIPELVDHSEHPVVACVLLDQLQRPDAEPTFRTFVLAAISLLELDFGSEVWDKIFSQAPYLLVNSNGEPLASAIQFLFHTASQCQRIPQAIEVVQCSLRNLGDCISNCVLDLLSETVNNCSDIATAMLREIESAFELDEKRSGAPTWYGGHDPWTKGVSLVDEQLVRVDYHFTDVYILIEMLSKPPLVNSFQVFERVVAQGLIATDLVAAVLGRRQAQRKDVNSSLFFEAYQYEEMLLGGTIKSFTVEEVDFTLILGIAAKFTLSSDLRVHRSGMMFYLMLLKMYPDENYQRRVLEGLVDCAMSPTKNSFEVDAALDVLVFMVHEEQRVAKVVFSMMREVTKLTLHHQQCAREDEDIHPREEWLTEFSNMARERATLLERLSDSEASTNQCKSEMKSEMERAALEKRKLSDQIEQVEDQLEWLTLERDNEVAKLSKEKRLYRDRVFELEAKLSQLKTDMCHELKRLVKEKNGLSELLKNAEAARKRDDDKLKILTSNTLALADTQKSLEGEVERWKQLHGRTESRIRKLEEKAMKDEEHIYNLEAKLDACQVYVHDLEIAHRDEILQHAPLYGVGLEGLSMDELDTLSCIHEQGLQYIQAIKKQKFNMEVIPFSGPYPHPDSESEMVPFACPIPVPVILPSSEPAQGVQHQDPCHSTAQWDPGSQYLRSPE